MAVRTLSTLMKAVSSQSTTGHMARRCRKIHGTICGNRRKTTNLIMAQRGEGQALVGSYALQSILHCTNGAGLEGTDAPQGTESPQRYHYGQGGLPSKRQDKGLIGSSRPCLTLSTCLFTRSEPHRIVLCCYQETPTVLQRRQSYRNNTLWEFIK